jgi:hypothetical protein
LACVLIAVAGNINGKIEPGRTGRIAAGIIGVMLLCAGLAMQVSARTVGTSATTTPGSPR